MGEPRLLQGPGKRQAHRHLRHPRRQRATIVYLLDFQSSTSARSMPRPASSRSIAATIANSRPRRGARRWRRTGSGTPNTPATPSACSIPRPRRSRNGWCRRHGRSPTTSSLDKNGEAWTGSMMSDRVSRLDPKTGQYRRVSVAADHQHPPRVRRRLDHARSRSGSAATTARRSSSSSRWIRRAPKTSCPAHAGHERLRRAHEL